MQYEANLIRNGTGTSTSGWDALNVNTSTNVFSFASKAHLKQKVERTDMNVEKRIYRFRCQYKFKKEPNPLKLEIRTNVRLRFQYFDQTIEQHTFPFTLKEDTDTDGWMQMEELIYAREDSIMNHVDVTIEAQESESHLLVRNVEFQRSITELEVHDRDPHPHELPLTISVDHNGIHGRKNGETKFWLRDDGDAIFAGDLEAASGTFTGSLRGVDGDFSGTLKAADGEFTGKVHAKEISVERGKIRTAQIENLTVGGNVQMGPNAYISWDNVTSQPSIEDISGASRRLTHISPSGIYTGNLTASQITAGSLSANRISGGTISGVRIDVDTDAYIGNYLHLKQSSSSGVSFGYADIRASDFTNLETTADVFHFYTARCSRELHVGRWDVGRTLNDHEWELSSLESRISSLESSSSGSDD